MNETTVQQKKRELTAHYEIARVLERELVLAQCQAQIKAGNVFGIVTRKDWAGQNISRWFDRTKNCWCLGDLDTLAATNSGTAKYIKKLYDNIE